MMSKLKIYTIYARNKRKCLMYSLDNTTEFQLLSKLYSTDQYPLISHSQLWSK